MFEPEPGPLDAMDEASLRPFVARPSFEGIVANALTDAPALDAALASSAAATTDNPSDDLDAVFAGTVGAANDVVDNQIAGAPVSPAMTLVATGDNADGIRQDQLRYLPSADSQISAPFVDPPPPPANYFDDGPPPPDPSLNPDNSPGLTGNA